MQWGCPIGASWGASGCAKCRPWVFEDGEPASVELLVAQPSIGVTLDVGVWLGAITTVSGYWYFGTVVAETPTVEDC